jgi:hypothetical protein
MSNNQNHPADHTLKLNHLALPAAVPTILKIVGPVGLPGPTGPMGFQGKSIVGPVGAKGKDTIVKGKKGKTGKAVTKTELLATMSTPAAKASIKKALGL